LIENIHLQPIGFFLGGSSEISQVLFLSKTLISSLTTLLHPESLRASSIELGTCTLLIAGTSA
jgi:hypothetical protein